MIFFLLLIGLNLPMAASPDDLPASQVVEMTLRHNILDRLRFGTCQSMEPCEAPPEELLAQPIYQSGHPLYYAAEFGDGQDRITTLVVDESGGTGKGYDTVYVDSNNDNRIDGEAERHGFKIDEGRGENRTRVPLAFTTAGETVEHQFDFVALYSKRRTDNVERLWGRLENGSYFSGEALIAGERRAIAIADLDSNGIFNKPEESLFQGDRFFVDLQEPYTEGSLASFAYGKYTQICGNWYTVQATPDGSRVEIREAAPAVGTVTAPECIVSATLWSPLQTLLLDFSEGKNQAVAGTYRLRRLQLNLESEAGKRWTNIARIKTGGPEVVVREGETVRLNAGPPFTIEIKASQAPESGDAELEFLCTGMAGEPYGNWRVLKGGRSSSPEIGFEILDETGAKVQADALKYG